MLNEFSKNEKDFLMFLFVRYENFYKKKKEKKTKLTPPPQKKTNNIFLVKLRNMVKSKRFTLQVAPQ